MSEEATRFTQYVNVRLAELHQRRQELAGAESNFETTCLTRKQELHQLQLALQARTEQLDQNEVELRAKEAELQTREAELQTKVTEFAPRETALASLEVALAAREVEVSAR